MSLKRDTLWTALDTFTSSGLSFLFRMVVAKALAPEQFGIVAMVLAVIAIVQVINDFGLTSALIQKDEARFSKSLIDATFSLSVLVASMVAVLTALVVAPLAAAYYETPAIQPLLSVLGASLLFSPFATVAAALLYRARRYREIAINRTVTTLVSLAVAGVQLWLSPSAWVVVTQLFVFTVTSTCGLMLAAKWRPAWAFDKQHIREILGFSGFVLISDILGQVNGNLGVFVLARLFTPNEVGLFGLAMYLTETVRRSLMSILNRVTFVHYSSLQSNIERLRPTYLTTVAWNCRALFPTMVALILFGPPMLVHFLGHEWAKMGPVVQILSMSIMVQTAGGMTSTLFKAVGRPGLETTIIFVTSFLILFPAIIAGGLLGGLVGVALGTLSAKIIAVMIRQIILDRIIGRTFKNVAWIVLQTLLVQAPLLFAWLVLRSVSAPSLVLQIACLVVALVVIAVIEIARTVPKPLDLLRFRKRAANSKLT